MKKTTIFGIAVLAIIFIVGFLAANTYKQGREVLAQIDSFEECRDAGYPVMESYPEQCRTPDGRTFVRDVATSTPDSNPAGGNSYKDLIRVTSVAPGAAITSPVTIRGEARGNWFFEANFPVNIVGRNGNIIAKGYAEAGPDPVTGEINWMTTDYVPFTAVVAFDSGAETEGFIDLEKSNASGLPENSDTFRIPVRFGAPAAPGGIELTACRPTGCSGQICAEEDMASTCEFRPEYACYKQAFAKCERQADGRCGWTESAQLSSCLANPPASE